MRQAAQRARTGTPLAEVPAAVPVRGVAQLSQQLLRLGWRQVAMLEGSFLVVAPLFAVAQRRGARLVSSEALVILGQQEVVRQRVRGQRAGRGQPGAARRAVLGVLAVVAVVEGTRVHVVVLRVVVRQAAPAAGGVPSPRVQHPRQVLQVCLQGLLAAPSNPDGNPVTLPAARKRACMQGIAATRCPCMPSACFLRAARRHMATWPACAGLPGPAPCMHGWRREHA